MTDVSVLSPRSRDSVGRLVRVYRPGRSGLRQSPSRVSRKEVVAPSRLGSYSRLWDLPVTPSDVLHSTLLAPSGLQSTLGGEGRTWTGSDDDRHTDTNPPPNFNFTPDP